MIPIDFFLFDALLKKPQVAFKTVNKTLEFMLIFALFSQN